MIRGNERSWFRKLVGSFLALLCVPAIAVTPVEVQKLEGTDDPWQGAWESAFGRSVAIDGDTAVIAAFDEESYGGIVYVFTRPGWVWIEQARLDAADGRSALAIDGDTIVIGRPGFWEGEQGSATVLARSGDDWVEEARLSASDGVEDDNFGQSVAIDGDTVIVASDNGGAYVFIRSGGIWTEEAKLVDVGDSGSVAIDDDSVIIGSDGAAYVFTRSGGVWTRQARLLASDGAEDDGFGGPVAIDGDNAVVGASEEDSGGAEDNGAAYVFTRSGGVWTEQAKLLASDRESGAYFGSSVAIDGDTTIVGAPYAISSTLNAVGEAYVFTRSGGVWGEAAKLLASDRATSDYFGSALAIDGSTVLVGAPENWRDEEGSGAAYVFSLESDGAVRLEAEDMQLDTYRPESLPFASGGALINLKGPGTNGSATMAFPGGTGQYDIAVVYHDENDGVAQLTVSIAGVSVDSWALDQRIPDGQQPEEFNRFTRQVATDYTVNSGDEIRIDGLQGNWDNANVDYIEFVPRLKPPPSGRIEAEDMQLDGYRVEALDFASGGALINLKGSDANGSATMPFPGATGQYDIVVAYHDENDGVAQLTVSIAGVSVDSWVLDQRVPDGQQPEEFNRFTRQIATDYTVTHGDEIRIDGLRGNWDQANVDYIEFVLTQPLPPGRRIEAEDMYLNNYSVESLPFASGGSLINLKGPATAGSASKLFPGDTGQYDIFVVYHDENDGVAQLTVTIEDVIGTGEEDVLEDSWLLDKKIPDGQQPEEFNRFTRQIATNYTVGYGYQIRIEGIQGNWDNANVDYIEFIPSQPPPSGRIEAEDMRLDGYRVEALDFASGGALINLKGPAVNGSATAQFAGASGQYDVIVVYHDENDGVAQLSVTIAGVSVDSWILDERIKDGQQPEEFNRFTRQIATNYTLNNGDEIRIDGLQGNWDNANVDYVEFVPR